MSPTRCGCASWASAGCYGPRSCRRRDPGATGSDPLPVGAHRERTREAQRLEKDLEDSGIKLSSVATNILGVSARAMLVALIDGERDPGVLAQLARGRMRAKLPELNEALLGRFGEHHAFLCRMHLRRVDELDADIAEIDTRIGVLMAPMHAKIELLLTIPGVFGLVAWVIIAETGGDMSRFPSPAHLASWAGVCPGNHESGGKRMSGHTRHGDHWLAAALGQAAIAAARSKNTYLGAQYRRLAPRLGRLKALVAIEHSILIAVWHMLTDDIDYHDLGADYFTKRDPERAARRAIRQLNQLGYTVTLNPIQAGLTINSSSATHGLFTGQLRIRLRAFEVAPPVAFRPSRAESRWSRQAGRAPPATRAVCAG